MLFHFDCSLTWMRLCSSIPHVAMDWWVIFVFTVRIYSFYQVVFYTDASSSSNIEYICNMD